MASDDYFWPEAHSPSSSFVQVCATSLCRLPRHLLRDGSGGGSAGTRHPPEPQGADALALCIYTVTLSHSYVTTLHSQVRAYLHTIDFLPDRSDSDERRIDVATLARVCYYVVQTDKQLAAHSQTKFANETDCTIAILLARCCRALGFGRGSVGCAVHAT